MKQSPINSFTLKLKGKTAVFIDWANVYKWKDSLKKEISLTKLYKYLINYRQIKEINFYFGTEDNLVSRKQLREAQKLGCKITTKPVKYLPFIENGIMLKRRKCDFDLEIGLDCFERLDKFDSFIFFSGDGDFATLYERLIKIRKQVIVIYAHGHLGREIWNMKKGLFKRSIDRLGANLFK
jgi:uncharacterized LabA/DUF88 family protein